MSLTRWLLSSQGRVALNILIPHESGGNLYIRELARAYVRSGHRVILGRENFLYLDGSYDVVHIHWPEQLYRLPYECGDDVERARFALDRLRIFKEQGAKCVLTMHNLMPHEDGTSKASRLICQGCFDEAEVVVHHCRKSIELTKAAYANSGDKKFVVLPHGHYFAYPAGMSREEARLSLGFSEKDFVFLYFGLIREYKGLDRVIGAFQKAKVKNKRLVVAGSLMSLPNLRQRFRFKWYRLCPAFTGSIFLHLRVIQNDEIQRFFQACDAVVLGHSAGLNSGVAVLGMCFGRVVIGPELGCIGEVLRSGDNVVYDPRQPGALVRAMEVAAQKDTARAAKMNRSVAKTWSWDAMVKGILEILGM